MEFITLGRTGLSVSKVGLGCGGFSRLGQSYGKSVEHSVSVVRSAMDFGINYIDTAISYGTDSIVGQALASVDRDKVVVSSKVGLKHIRDKELPVAQAVEDSLSGSLKRLQTDYLDVFHIHGLSVTEVDFAFDELVPALQNAKEEGKIRYLAVSEAFGKDTGHAMFQKVLDRNVFDVVMVGFNVLNPSARRHVFPTTIKNKVGTEIMFAIRNSLYKPDNFREIVGDLVEEGKLEESAFEGQDPVNYVFGSDDPKVMTEMSYRYAAYEPGADILLSGTGNVDHLKTNIEYVLKGPLEKEQVEKIDSVFANIDSVSGN